MLQNIMTAFGLKNSVTDDGTGGFSSRRSYPRRGCDQCVGFLDGKAHPVLDWSPGGLRVFADPRPLQIGQEMEIELKFHLRDQLVNVKQRARIVRKSTESVSFQFAPVSNDIRKTFQTVIDDFNAREFSGSQA
ncbi:MAG: PilZ domain-containing protein [Alphaproteobacteria bacterium]|nr:PilZ domain-containing protein [Alphaproteobacteria bacterium]